MFQKHKNTHLYIFVCLNCVRMRAFVHVCVCVCVRLCGGTLLGSEDFVCPLNVKQLFEGPDLALMLRLELGLG